MRVTVALGLGLFLFLPCCTFADGAPTKSSSPTRNGAPTKAAASADGEDDGASADDGSTAPKDDGAKSAEPLPPSGPLMGRSSFVVTMMSDQKPNAAWARLAEYSLSSDGKVTIAYWQWDQSSFTGDASTNKVPTATTKGCLRSCVVKAPLGFERGASPKTATGTFEVSATNEVTVTWNDHVERWSATDLPSLTKMTLASSSDGARLGYAFGSRAPLDEGASIDQVSASGLITGPYFSNAYDAKTISTTDKIGFSDWARCTEDESLQVKTNTDPDKKKWWNAYIAGNPSEDGRKMFWNHERGVVTQSQSPGATCISSGGGHTFALLQILDDSGDFQGWVSAEGSQHGRYSGGDIVSIAALTRP